jgi:hypothetical protein
LGAMGRDQDPATAQRIISPMRKLHVGMGHGLPETQMTETRTETERQYRPSSYRKPKGIRTQVEPCINPERFLRDRTLVFAGHYVEQGLPSGVTLSLVAC